MQNSRQSFYNLQLLRIRPLTVVKSKLSNKWYKQYLWLHCRQGDDYECRILVTVDHQVLRLRPLVRVEVTGAPAPALHGCAPRPAPPPATHLHPAGHTVATATAPALSLAQGNARVGRRAGPGHLCGYKNLLAKPFFLFCELLKQAQAYADSNWDFYDF